MNFPTVAQVKAHIRVEIEDEEDDLIQEYIELKLRTKRTI